MAQRKLSPSVEVESRPRSDTPVKMTPLPRSLSQLLEEEEPRKQNGTSTQDANSSEQPSTKEEGDKLDAKKAIHEQKEVDVFSKLPRDVRDYIAKDIAPILVEGLEDLCRRKPEQPIIWLAQWLMRNNPKNASSTQHDKSEEGNEVSSGVATSKG